MTIAAMWPRLANAAEPPAPLGNSKLATMALRGDDLAPVWNALVARVNADPSDAGAFLDLSIIAHIQGRPADRAALRERAFALTRVFRQPAARTPAALRLLAFVAGGDYLANMPIEFLLDGSSVTLDLVYVLPGQPLPDVLPEHDAAFVAIAELNENQPLLNALAGILGAWPRPVIDRPEKVAPLTRDGTWALLNNAAGLVVPVCARIARAGLEVLRGAYDVENCSPVAASPPIARRRSRISATASASLDDAHAIAAYLRERAEGESTSRRSLTTARRTGFTGISRRADRRPRHAVHMAVPSHWMIRSINADMKLSGEKRAEEARCMADFDRDFGVRHAQALSAICARVGLGLSTLRSRRDARDGKLFGCSNSAPSIIGARHGPAGRVSYKRPQMAKVFSAFAAMLSRARQEAARQRRCRAALRQEALASTTSNQIRRPTVCGERLQWPPTSNARRWRHADRFGDPLAGRGKYGWRRCPIRRGRLTFHDRLRIRQAAGGADRGRAAALAN